MRLRAAVLPLAAIVGCGVPSIEPTASSNLCSGAACAGACAPGYADCDADLAGDGCESSLASVTSCGACGVVCRPGQLCTVAGCEWPSCAEGGAGLRSCGAKGDESCCASLPVPAGTFPRAPGEAATAAVSALELDRYEITVGRFRAFLHAWMDAGWRPAAGAGKHAQLPGGGLPGDTGWDPGWAFDFPTSFEQWFSTLTCDNAHPEVWTWTWMPADHEARPASCLKWAWAYAFCVWDGGFVPTEAEWQLAAGGGDEARAFPWGVEPPDASRATWCGAPYCGTLVDVGAHSPRGDGRFGQADLAGGLAEWVLDGWRDALPPTCVDCAQVKSADGLRTLRGGSWIDPADALHTWARAPRANINTSWIGARCARPPR